MHRWRLSNWLIVQKRNNLMLNSMASIFASKLSDKIANLNFSVRFFYTHGLWCYDNRSASKIALVDVCGVCAGASAFALLPHGFSGVVLYVWRSDRESHWANVLVLFVQQLPVRDFGCSDCQLSNLLVASETFQGILALLFVAYGVFFASLKVWLC